MKKIITLMMFSMLLYSCVKEIELNNQNQKQKDVVNCILSVDSSMNLALYKSNLPLSSNNKFTLIKDAQVEISESGNSETLVFSGGDYIEYGQAQGYYSSNQTIEGGKTYSLKIEGNNNKSLNAETYVPISPDILEPNIIFGTEEAELIFTINDPSSEDNYYSIELVTTMVSFEYHDTDTIFFESFTDNAYLYSKKDNGGFISFKDDLSGTKILFDDKILIAGNNDIRLFTYLPSSYTYEDSYVTYATIVSDAYINVSSISKSLYDYEKSTTKQMYSQQDPFSEIVQLKGNINNGLGVFGSKNSKRFDIEL